MGRMYTEKEMDRLMKINLRLVKKFKSQLSEEYGTNITDIMNMFDTLYREQCEETPLLWYEYGFGITE